MPHNSFLEATETDPAILKAPGAHGRLAKFSSCDSNRVSFDNTFRLRFWDATCADVMRFWGSTKKTQIAIGRHELCRLCRWDPQVRSTCLSSFFGSKFGLVLLTLTSDLPWFAGFVSAQGFTVYTWWASRLKGLVVLMDDVWAPSCVFGFSFQKTV